MRRNRTLWFIAGLFFVAALVNQIGYLVSDELASLIVAVSFFVAMVITICTGLVLEELSSTKEEDDAKF